MITIKGEIELQNKQKFPNLQLSGSDSLSITVITGKPSKEKTHTCLLNVYDDGRFTFELDVNSDYVLKEVSSTGLWLTDKDNTVWTKWELSGHTHPKNTNELLEVKLKYVLIDIKCISRTPSIERNCKEGMTTVAGNTESIKTEVENIARNTNSIKGRLDTTATNNDSINTGIDKLTNSLNTYPLMISDSDVGRGRTANALSGHSDSNLNRIAESAMRKILGRVPAPGDYKSFRNSLNQSFEIRQVEGHTEYTWNPRGYAGQADLGGGVTGHQASIYKRAKVMLENVIPLLDGLYSLKVNTNLEAAEGIRNIIKSSLEGVVRELGLEGGPRVAKVDDLFTRVKDMLDEFAVLFGLKDNNLVDSLEKDLNYSSYLAVKDYINSIEESWDTSKGNLSDDLGAKLIALSRSLSVTAESVGELIWAYDSVHIGESERKTIEFEDDNKTTITVQDYLDWVLHFTEEEAPNLIHVGGRNGISQLKEPINKLSGYARKLSKRPDNHPRVNKAIELLETNLNSIGNKVENAFNK